MAAKTLNTYVFLILLVSIISSYLFAETNLKNAVIFIAASAVVKFFAVSFQFMETKHAHIIWKVLIGFFSLVYLLSIIYFY